MVDIILNQIQVSLANLLVQSWYFFVRGGFILFICLTVYILAQMYLEEIRTHWASNIDWVFLQIKTPKENLVSLLSVEQIYTQLSASLAFPTFAQKYVEGVDQIWFSLEIVSLGGKISFIIRAPKKFQDLVEAAFYAQYPDCEITEVEDYLKNVEYNHETSNFDLWGTEMKMLEDTAFPLKTYKDYEHALSEQKIIDPLDGLLEGMGRMEPHEFYGLQILIRPIVDAKWQEKGMEKFKALVGDKVSKNPTLAESIINKIDSFTSTSFLALFSDKKPEDAKKREMANLTDVEKLKINSLQRKLSKHGFQSKIRHLYIAPKDKQDGKGRAITLGLGFMKSFANEYGNKLVVKGETNTKLDYKVSPNLEEPFIKYTVNKRKDVFFQGYKGRSFYIGGASFILNTEELTTLYHLPISVGSTLAPVDKTTFKKGQPPANLPI
jgi:hypothetical protein